MKTMDVEVVDIRKITGDGNVKAFAAVKLADCMVIKGFRVVNGKNGLFVSMPSKASKDGRWFDILEPEEGLKRDLEDKVLEAFDRETDGVSS